jgi:hypothetical protein
MLKMKDTFSTASFAVKVRAASWVAPVFMHLLPKTPTAEGRAQRAAARNMTRKVILDYQVDDMNTSRV